MERETLHTLSEHLLINEKSVLGMTGENGLILFVWCETKLLDDKPNKTCLAQGNIKGTVVMSSFAQPQDIQTSTCGTRVIALCASLKMFFLKNVQYSRHTD